MAEDDRRPGAIFMNGQVDGGLIGARRKLNGAALGPVRSGHRMPRNLRTVLS
jgi:hypothetical protein